MGLFGYNEKDFERNKGQMKDRLEEILAFVREAQKKGRFGELQHSKQTIGSKINGIIVDIEFSKFSNSGNKKDYENIDERMNKLIGACFEDISEDSVDALLLHVMALDDVCYSERKFGKAKPQEDIEAFDKLLKLKVQLGKLRSNRDSLTAKKAALDKEYDEVFAKNEQDPYLDDLDSELNQIEEDLEDCKVDMQDIQDVIDTDTAIINAKGRSAVTKIIAENSISAREADKIFAQVERERSAVRENTDEKKERKKQHQEEMGRSTENRSNSRREQRRARAMAGEMQDVANTINNSDVVSDLSSENHKDDTLNRS